MCLDSTKQTRKTKTVTDFGDRNLAAGYLEQIRALVLSVQRHRPGWSRNKCYQMLDGALVRRSRVQHVRRREMLHMMTSNSSPRFHSINPDSAFFSPLTLPLPPCVHFYVHSTCRFDRFQLPRERRARLLSRHHSQFPLFGLV